MVPGCYGFSIKFVRIHFAAEKIADLPGIQGSHPCGKPAPARKTHPPQHPFDLEVQAHIHMRNRKPFRHGTYSPIYHSVGESPISSRGLESAKRIVAGEEFVASVTAQGYGHILARKFRNECCRKNRTVSHDFVQLPCRSPRPRQTSFGGKNLFVMQRSRGLCSKARIC